ncbi:MAG: TolC family protein [Brumimicrobium sp.]
MNKVIISIIILSITNFISVGQEKLSASDAVMHALENNFQMQIANKQIEVAEKNNKWSEAGLFPTVELTAGYNHSIVDNTNNPFTFTPGLIYNGQVNPGINANWNIFSGFGVKITKERLEQLETQSKGNASLILENTAYDVLIAYYNALYQESQLKNFQEVYKLSKKQSKYEEDKQNLGQSNQLAVVQMKNQLLSDSINIMQQKVVRDNAYRNLLLLMNVDKDELTQSQFPELIDSLGMPLETIENENLTEKITNNNQNLKNQLINLELQKSNTQLQRSFLYPTLGLQVGASPSFGNFRALNDDNLNAETQQISYFANVSLRYSLFDNWKNKRAVEVSKIEEEISKLNVDELEKELITNSHNLIELYSIRNQLVNVALANKEYAKQAYDMGLTRYNLGSINSIDLLQLRNSFLEANLNYADLLHQRMQTYLELYRLTGMLQLEYNK